MKKILLLFVVLLLLAGCGGTAGQEPAKTASVEPTQTPTVAHTPEPTPEPTPDLGSKENPMPIGETFLGTYTDGSEGNQYVIGISLQETIRGDEALDVILDTYSLNPKPDEGKEYLIAWFQVGYISDITEDNPPLYLNKFNFVFASSEGDFEYLPTVIMPEPAFDITLNEYDVSDGWLVFSVDVEDKSPKAVFANSLWFNLS